MFETHRLNISATSDYVLIWIKTILEVIIVLIYDLITTFIKFIINFIQGFPNKTIQNQLALVTGGANGLGREICIELAKKGCNVAVVDIDLKSATKLSTVLTEQYKIKSKAYQVDISNFNEVQALKTQIDIDLGPVDILVNNAGLIPLKYTIHSTSEETQRIINVNLMAHFWTISVFIDDMKQRKSGHIVATSSVAAITPFPISNSYSSSKSAVCGLMESLYTDLIIANLQNQIQLTTVFPYFMATNNEIIDFMANNHFMRFIPALTPNYTAQQIIDGVLKNKRKIYIPGVYIYLATILSLLPRRSYEYFVSKVYQVESQKM